MKKYSLILLIIIFLVSFLQAKPAHEKIDLGMSLNAFNALSLGTFIPNQKRKSALTSYGLVHLDSSATKRFFNLKGNIWEGILVEMKNNKVSQFTLQGTTDIDQNKLQDVFSDLLRMHGVTFSLNNYRSLSKKGYSVIWHDQNQLVSLNITIDKHKKCAVSLKKAISTQQVKAPKLNENAIVALEPLLGKDFHKLEPFQIATGDNNIKENIDNQLGDLLN
jgi:hypothetical protein